MTDLKEPLLPPWPSVSVAHEAPCRSTMPGRPLFQGLDLLGVKKRGQGIQSSIRIDKNGSSEVLEVDKLTTMKRCDFLARDLHLLDLLFVYPSIILGRERAIVENLEQIRCIIRAHEVLLLNSMENYVLQYVAELQRCLNVRNDMVNNVWHSREQGSSLFPLVSSRQELRDDAMFSSTQSSQQKSISDAELYSGSSVDDFPFEFRVLEVALEAACTFLDTQEKTLMNFQLFFEVVTGAAEKQSKEKTTVTNNNSSKNKSGIKARASKSQAMPSKLPPPKDEDDTLDEEEDDEHGDTLCGAWGENYASDEFWICCDNV